MAVLNDGMAAHRFVAILQPREWRYLRVNALGSCCYELSEAVPLHYLDTKERNWSRNIGAGDCEGNAQKRIFS